jgi:hypothetical protein
MAVVGALIERAANGNLLSKSTHSNVDGNLDNPYNPHYLVA